MSTPITPEQDTIIRRAVCGVLYSVLYLAGASAIEGVTGSTSAADTLRGVMTAHLAVLLVGILVGLIREGGAS